MRTFDKSTLHFISLFELVTGIAPMDCIDCDIIYFIVPEESINKILMKGRNKLKMLEKHVGKQVIIFPYLKTKEDFIKRVISDKVKIKDSDDSLKLFINRQDNKRIKRDLKAIKSFLERIYNVENVLFRF